MRHVISILLENESGSLSRVAGLFSARGYNIESLSVAPTLDDTVSRMTLVTTGSEQIVEQIVKQLNKLIDVVKLQELGEQNHMEREMLLLKVAVDAATRSHVKDISDIFLARIINVSRHHFVIEFMGEPNRVQAIIDAMAPAKIVEIVRSGSQGISLSDKPLQTI